MSAVPSVLPESTTIISSAHDTESSAASMCADSSRVMTVTVSFGTWGVYRVTGVGQRKLRASGGELRLSGKGVTDRRARAEVRRRRAKGRGGKASGKRAGGTSSGSGTSEGRRAKATGPQPDDRSRCQSPTSEASLPFADAKLSNRCDLHRVEGDERAVVVDERAQLGLLGAREVALRLEQLEGRRESDGEALVLGVEPPLGELARLSRGFHPLEVRVHLARGLTDLRGDDCFQIRQLRRLLLLLQLRLRERRVRLALAERIREVQLHEPRAEGVRGLG